MKADNIYPRPVRLDTDRIGLVEHDTGYLGFVEVNSGRFVYVGPKLVTPDSWNTTLITPYVYGVRYWSPWSRRSRCFGAPWGIRGPQNLMGLVDPRNLAVPCGRCFHDLEYIGFGFH